MMTATRTEAVKIDLELNTVLAKKYEDELKTIFKGRPSWCSGGGLRDGDLLKVSYGFYASYFDECEACLRAVAKIVEDESVVVNVNVEELRYGESLILKLGGLLQELQTKIAERKQ